MKTSHSETVSRVCTGTRQYTHAHEIWNA